MRGNRALFGLGMCLFGAGLLTTAGHPQTASKPTFKETVKPFLAKYCVSCHSGKDPAAGVDFTKFDSDVSVIDSPDIWTQAARYLASKHMPPVGNEAPPDAERASIVKWIQKTLASPCGLNDPGRVTIARLNKLEYRNTVRDLLGVDFKGTDDFPSDDVGYGFDNIGDVLTLSPLLMEKYLNAAEQIAQSTIVDRYGPTTEYDPLSFKPESGSFSDVRESDFEFYSEGTAVQTVPIKKTGRYLIRIRAYGDQAGPDPAQMAVSIDGKEVNRVWVKGASRAEAADFDFPMELQAGKHALGFSFTNDYYNPKDPDPKNRDRNLYVENILVRGPEVPIDDEPDTQLRLIPVEPKPGEEIPTAKAIFAKLASRAYRRPATPEEVNRLCKYVDLALKNGDSFDVGIQLGIEAMLTSPNFLFRVETGPNPNDPNAKNKLNPYEIASRLSYFLWSTMPDQELLDKAADGSLAKPAVLVEEAMRMLKNPKARALSDDFATQWLTLRKLTIVDPDKKTYPEFDDQLRHDMETETQLFFQSVVNQNGSVLDFLDGKYSYINGPLAELYGIKGVTGNQFRKVSLDGTERCGLITQASVLTVTSNPTRTSPVKRGKWVLEEILGTPPPPPPPGVGVLKEEAAETGVQTLRQMMEEHRKNPMCAACHERMDPLGFGLENFDGVGKWREKEGTLPIDASGKLPDGRQFDGPQGLVKILMGQKDLFVRCLAEKLLTYALGRGLTASDQCVLDDIAKATAKDDYRFDGLVKAIVLSNPFLNRRGDEGSTQ